MNAAVHALNRSLLTTLVFFSGVGLYCLRMSELSEQMSALFWFWLMRASLVLLIFSRTAAAGLTHGADLESEGSHPREHLRRQGTVSWSSRFSVGWSSSFSLSRMLMPSDTLQPYPCS